MAAKKAWNLGPYDAREVLSAFRKCIVLADLDASVYWAHTILTFGGKGGQRLLAKQAWIVAAEVAMDPLVVVRAKAVYDMAGVVPETDHLFQLVAHLVAAPKWWESEEGRALEEAWSRAIGDLKDPKRRREVPSYARDRHTRAGWEEFRRTGRWDDRFSGDERGRTKTLHLFLRDGHLSADAALDDLDPEFVARWARLLEVQAMSLPDVGPGVDDPDPSLFDEDDQ